MDRVLHFRRQYGWHLLWLVVLYYFFFNKFPFAHAIRRDGFLSLYGFTLLAMLLCWLFYPWRDTRRQSVLITAGAVPVLAFVVVFFQNSIQNRILGDLFGLCCLEVCYYKGGSAETLARLVFWLPVFGGFLAFARLWEWINRHINSLNSE